MIGERIDIWKEQLIEQGMLAGKMEGMQQGKLEGKLEGQAELLRRFLIRRFGILPAGVESQISAANLEQIECWFDHCMDAPSLGAVFTQH